MRIHAWLVTAVLALATGACSDIYYGPRLPAAFVSSDEALLGIWLVSHEQAGGVCTIEEIAIPVEDGLINPASWKVYLVGDERGPEEVSELAYKAAYRITIRASGTSDPGKVLYGYVVPIGEERYLGIHVGVGELAKSLGPFLTIPTFVLTKYELNDEVLRVWMPHTAAICLPNPDAEGVQAEAFGLWLTVDGMVEANAAYQLRGGLVLVPTIGELIAYYEEHAADEGFFDDRAYEFTRKQLEPDPD